MVIGSFRDNSFVLSSEKHFNGSDEGGVEELSTTINNTMTNYEHQNMGEDGMGSPKNDFTNIH